MEAKKKKLSLLSETYTACSLLVRVRRRREKTRQISGEKCKCFSRPRAPPTTTEPFKPSWSRGGGTFIGIVTPRVERKVAFFIRISQPRGLYFRRLFCSTVLLVGGMHCECSLSEIKGQQPWTKDTTMTNFLAI